MVKNNPKDDVLSQHIFEASRDAIFIFDIDGCIVKANPAACELYDYTQDEFRGLEPKELVHPDDRARYDELFDSISHKGDLRDELKNIRKDGSTFDVEVRLTTFEREGHRYLLGLVRDITEGTQAEKAIKTSRGYAESICETIREPLLVLNANLRVISANRHFYQTFRMEPAETEGKMIYNLGDHQWDIPELRKLLGEILPQETAFNDYEIEHDFADIGRRMMLLNAREILREEDKERLILLAIEDVTERKRAEEKLKEYSERLEERVEERVLELRESEARYRTIFDTTAVSIWEEDFSAVYRAIKNLESQGVTDLRAYLDGHPAFIDQVMHLIEVKDVNNWTLEMFGAETKKELLDSFDKAFTPETREILREEILAIQEGKTYFEGETVNRTLQGEKLHVLLSMTIPPEEEELDSVLVSMMDITGRKRAEESLVEQGEKFRTIFNNANDALYVHKLTEGGMPGRIIEVNDTACEMLGYTKEEFRTMSPQDIDGPEAAAKVPDIMQDLFKEGDVTFETQHVTKEGSQVPVEVSSHLFTLAEERLVLSVARNITERKEAERALKESEEKYRRFFQTSQYCVFITSRDGQWLEMNQAAVDMFGYESKEDLGNVNVASLYANSEEREKHLSEIDNKGFTKDYPVKLRKKDGTVMHTLISSTPYREEGEFVGYQGTIRDITEQVRYIEEIKQQSKQLQALREVGLNLVSNLDLVDLLENIVHHAVELVDGTGGSFSILDPDREVLDLDVYMGYESIPEDTTIVQGEGLVGNVWARKESILVEDYAAWEGHAPQWVDHIGHCSMVGVPVEWGGEMLGVLEVLREPGKPFSEKDSRLLELFANQAAVAVHNANLFKQTNQGLKRLQIMREIDRAISGSIDLKTTLNVLVDRLVRNLEVDAGDILLYRPTMQNLEYVTGTGFRSDAFREISVRIGEGQAGRAAYEREIIHVSDLSLKTDRFERVRLIQQEKFVVYFGVPLIAKGEIVGVLEVFHRSPLDPSQEWMGFLKALAGQAAIAVNNAQLFEDLQRSNLELIQAYDGTLEGWAKALELKDQETEDHARRVIEMTMTLAEKMGVGEDKLPHIRRGALLHDIGKMGIPDHILQKEGPLDEEEWALMKQHPQYAYNLLSDIDYLKPAMDIPYCHHEKWDGTGYPQGLEGEEIPLAARIFALVDVWDALRSDRSYRDAWPDEKALAYIKEQSGKHFDPEVVKAFLEVINT